MADLREDLHNAFGEMIDRRNPAVVFPATVKSVDTANNLDAGGVYTVLHTTEGGKHQLPDRTLLATQTSNFFYKTMKLAELAPA